MSGAAATNTGATATYTGAAATYTGAAVTYWVVKSDNTATDGPLNYQFFLNLVSAFYYFILLSYILMLRSLLC